MKVLITAGPTREAIDPVRFLSNRSTGKMGYAIAQAAINAGHQVILISGPTALQAPDTSNSSKLIKVESAQEMYDAVESTITYQDIAIFCAAVADYTPVHQSTEKIKKNEDSLTLELKKTKDILGSAREIFGYQGVLVGFAAESENLLINSKIKLKNKGCDMIAANDISNDAIGFASDENQLSLLFTDNKKIELSKQSKAALGEIIINECEKLHQIKQS